MRKHFCAVVIFAFIFGGISFQSRSGPDLTNAERYVYGQEVELPDAVVLTAVATREGIFSANAFLVDADRGIFVTAFHVVEGIRAAQIFLPRTHQILPVLGVLMDPSTELAVIVTPPVPGLTPLTLATGPPTVGQIITLASYHAVGRHPRPYGFRCSFRVERSATDSCVSPGSCIERDEVRALAAHGPIDAHQVWELYPFMVYATDAGVHHPVGMVGLVPGMSGGPVFDDTGAVIGVASQLLRSDPAGWHVLFASAYKALPMVAQVRAMMDGEVPVD